MHGLPRNAIFDPKTGHIIVQKPLPTFNCLALEGAGVRGPAYAGAISILSHYGILDHIQYVAGSSAGALAATLIALGYSTEEIAEQLQSMPIDLFLNDKPSWSLTPLLFSQIRKVYSLITNTPLSTGKTMLEWLKDRVREKLGNENATFADLARKVVSEENKHAANKAKYLYITATNIGLAIPECVIFSHETNPQASTPIAEAAYASAAFPAIVAAIKINGHHYIDGGCKNNLPAKIFDRKRFLPENYDFTNHGVNPGTLSIKIDYTDEINQLIWGIKKPFHIKNARDLATAVSYAFTDNIDANEVRESRIIIPLRDNNIGSFTFTIDVNGRIQLSSSAEDTTQEFLENYLNTAYDVIIFKSVKEWLTHLSLDELDDMITIYGNMTPKPDKVDEYIKFLKDFFEFKRANKTNPDIEFTQPFPDYHINIKPDSSEAGWNTILKKEITDRITMMKKHLTHVESRINNFKSRFAEGYDDFLVQQLHDDEFDDVKIVTGFLEYKRILEAEIGDLELKLGLRKSREPENFFNHQYSVLCEAIETYKSSSTRLSSIDAIFAQIDIYHPVIAHSSTEKSDNILFTYNLRQKDDCQIFLIAAILYLKYRRSKEIGVFEKMYSTMFDDLKYPKTMYALSTQTGKQGVPLLCAAYRIEELMQYFERTEHPDKSVKATIDKAFGITKNPLYRFFNRYVPNNTQEMGIAMKNIFRTHPSKKARLFCKNSSDDIDSNNTIEMRQANASHA